MKKVKVKMLVNTFVKGELAEKGKTFEVSEKDAAFLVPRGKAELAKETKKSGD